jgi:hypothetical protein
MLDHWLQDLESLEEISQDEDTRRIFLRMAAMSQAGTLDRFVHQLRADDDVDAETKGTLTELAGDETFLYVVDDYLRSTHRVH